MGIVISFLLRTLREYAEGDDEWVGVELELVVCLPSRCSCPTVSLDLTLVGVCEPLEAASAA